MARYGRCIYCGQILTVEYGQTQTTCPRCGAVYGLADTGGRGELFGPIGSSGEGWWLLGGFIFGVIVGSATGRALLASAIGLTREEIERRAKELQARMEARKR
jgi:ribosomal protein S27E